MDEKLYLLDNIIDYLYYNFKQLKAEKEENKDHSPNRKKFNVG